MPYKVLIVDDIKTNCELIREILKSSGNDFIIEELYNGKDVLNFSKDFNPDLILLDLMMPEVSGIDVIDFLKKDPQTKEIPIIVITAYDSEENLLKSFNIGAIDYIKKPINKTELLSRINKVLDIKSYLNTVKEKIKIYEEKQKEYEELNIITKYSNNAYLKLNLKGEIIWANEGFQQIHGYTLDEYKTLFGSTIFSICKDPEIFILFNKVIKEKTPVNFISKIKTKNSEEKWLQIFIIPKTNNGNIDSLLVTEVDITNLKKKEEELNRQNQRMKIIMENLEKANRLLEDQKKEISRQKELLQEEQAKTEKLLLNMFPLEIAKQLKNKGTAVTRYYKMVTVMFADFKDFTRISKTLDPKDLVNILDSYFAKFDEIIGRHYLEKIKTIGDAYMAAGGLPLRNKSNPFDAVLAALEIQDFMNKLNDSKAIQNLPIWELRIGIHTGPVVAGVIGRKKFLYDIWGETVNIASRMEEAGHMGMVNISEATYEHIKEYFECIYRGKIEAKNIGKIDMYFVTRLKPEYSADEYGIIPNDKFISMINKL